MMLHIRMTRLSRIVAVLIAAVGIMFASITTPSAAIYYGSGMNSQVFCLQNPAVNSTWLAAINNGRNAWNNHSSFPGSISVYGGCTSYMQVGSYGIGWLGLYSPLVPGYQYRIRLDSANLNNHISLNGYTFANVVKSTTAHEFGHALKLGDHSNGPSLLMSSARNRNSVTSPTTYEVNESNSYY